MCECPLAHLGANVPSISVASLECMSIQPPTTKPVSHTWQDLARQLCQETDPKRTVQIAKELTRVMDAAREREKQEGSLVFYPPNLKTVD